MTTRARDGQHLQRRGNAGSVAILMTVLAAVTGCRQGGVGDSGPDGGTIEDGGDSGPDGDGGSCGLLGTYNVESVEVVEGSCDFEPGDDQLAIRRAGPWTLVDFEGISWRDAALSAGGCRLEVDGPESSFWNGVLRTSSVEISVDDDRAVALFSDRLEGEDSLGRTCDVTWRLELHREGPPPEGAATGEDGCGGVGCSASRCAFGQIFGCASGVCLLDATASEWLETFCSEPCATDEECPDGLECMPTYEHWHGAPEGSYCARWRAVCGNGELEEGETCDDGNTVGGDGCSGDCSSDESCGNGRFERTEQCEASAPLEWLPCTDGCRLDPPEGVVTPVPLWASKVRIASTGPGRFVAVATGSSIYDIDAPPLYVAHTDDGGETWTEGTITVDGWGWPIVTSLSASGERVVAGMLDGGGGMLLAESDNGGRSWSAASAQTLPAGTSTTGAYGEASLRILAVEGGGTVAAVRSADEGVAVMHRSVGSSTWTPAGTLDTTPPAGATSCDWHWIPYRFERRSNGAGLGLFEDAGQVRLVAGGVCIVETRWVHTLQSMVSDDGGATFGPTEDLVVAAGLAESEIAMMTDSVDGPAAACVGGRRADDEHELFCGAAPSDGGAWAMSPTGITWSEAWASEPPDGLGRTPTGRLVVAQRLATDFVVRLHVTETSGTTWTTIDVPDANSFNRGLFPLAGDVVWLLEVDYNNEASLVRVDLASAAATERFHLFGDARREDGSGYPWDATWSADGSGQGLLGFSLPDDLRSTVTVLRRMD